MAISRRSFAKKIFVSFFFINFFLFRFNSNLNNEIFTKKKFSKIWILNKNDS